jgi:Cu/Ag efflux protein CusF
MRRVFGTLFLIGLGIAFAGCASEPADEGPLHPSGTIEENLASETAEVIAIDPSTRNLALRMPDGTEVAFQAGPEVRNLDQVAAGDLVRVSYLESIVYHVRKPGEAVPGVTVERDGIRAEPGQAPGAAVAQLVTVTATVRALDPAVPSVTLEAANGQRRTIRVRDAERLAGVKVGDLVDFTYTQALAVEVEKVAR